MIVALVLFVLIFIFFALFIGKNLSNVCDFWLFHTFQHVPATVLVLMSFAMGITFAVLFFIIVRIKQTTSAELEATKEERAARANIRANKRKEKKAKLEEKKARMAEKEKIIRKNKETRAAEKLARENRGDRGNRGSRRNREKNKSLGRFRKDKDNIISTDGNKNADNQ